MGSVLLGPFELNLVHLRDCVEAMQLLPVNCIDAIVCDPPYGLEFMGKEWDKLNWQSGGSFSKPGIGDRKTEWPSFSATSRYGATNPTCAKCGGRLRGAKRCACAEPEWKPIGKRRNPENEGLPDDATGGGMQQHLSAMQEWHYVWAVEALRVAKPGSYLLAFGGTRTYHRLACAVEDAGWEIRDCVMWLYGSGFPKSLNVAQAIDKAARGCPQGSTKGDPKKRGTGSIPERNVLAMGGSNGGAVTGLTNDYGAFVPESDAAKQWDGWGTCLKPAWEPCIVARKPLEGTVVQNVLKYGTGAVNIDACRVPVDPSVDDMLREVERKPRESQTWEKGSGFKNETNALTGVPEKGRFPANVIHDGSDEVTALFPQTGEGHTPSSRGKGGLGCNGHGGQDAVVEQWHDAGSAARFFKTCTYKDIELLFCRAKAILTAWSDDAVSTADGSSVLSNEGVVFALNRAAIAASLGDKHVSAVRGLSTNVTVSECGLLCEALIVAILSSASERLRGLLPAAPIPNGCRVSIVATSGPTATMTIMISHWKSSGSVDAVTFDIMPSSADHGVAASANRVFYCAKANKDRSSFNEHPTLKPTDLMKYLCKLVTPPNGIVLDPFTGSGSTGVAALECGFKFLGFEKDPKYYDIAKKRIILRG